MSECILWEGALDSHGYGVRRWRGKRGVKAHRISYATHHGLDVFTMGGVLRHTCDTPHCINPEHLILGTQYENMQDMVAKGRQLRGADANGAILTQEVVDIIRATYVFRCPANGGRALARRFGVTPQTICDILKGRSWSG